MANAWEQALSEHLQVINQVFNTIASAVQRSSMCMLVSWCGGVRWIEL